MRYIEMTMRCDAIDRYDTIRSVSVCVCVCVSE